MVLLFRQKYNTLWNSKLNKKHKYLLCPVPESGDDIWRRQWLHASGLISAYDVDVSNKKDEDAGIISVKGNLAVRKALAAKAYTYSFVFFR